VSLRNCPSGGEEKGIRIKVETRRLGNIFLFSSNLKKMSPSHHQPRWLQPL
jgi:hypothetical protein